MVFKFINTTMTVLTCLFHILLTWKLPSDYFQGLLYNLYCTQDQCCSCQTEKRATLNILVGHHLRYKIALLNPVYY